MTPLLRLAAICLAVSGCAPHVSYTHLSDPRIAGDGYDLMCAGGIYRKANFEARAAGCYNTARAHGEFLKLDISYVWDPVATNIALFADNSVNKTSAPGSQATSDLRAAISTTATEQE